jgi:hypothetical protein
MGKKKEGVISSVPEAIAEAAEINIAATKEAATSAVTSFVDTVIGREASKGKATCAQEETFLGILHYQAQRQRRNCRQKACSQGWSSGTEKFVHKIA